MKDREYFWGSISLAGFVELVRLAEEDIADNEQDDQRTDSDVSVLQPQTEDDDLHIRGELVDQTHQGHAEEGSALAADVHQAVEFAALLGGDDLAQVGAAQCLDGTLEHTDHYGQEPELPLADQEHTEQGDAGIADDADLHQLGAVMIGGQLAEEDGAGEGYDLGQQQCQQQACGVQTQSSAVG